MKNILLAVFLFAIGYDSGWAIIHYLVDMSKWANWQSDLVIALFPLLLGIGCIFSYPTFKKVV